MPKEKKHNEENEALYEYDVSKRDKIIYIKGEIDEDTADRVMKALDMFCNSNDQKKDNVITIKINSGGGEIYSGLAIIDAIEAAKKKKFKIITKASGAAMSMAAWILASGSKRYATRNTFIMIHQGWYDSYGNWQETKKEHKHNEALEKRCWDLLSEYTKTSAKKWEEKCVKGSWYMDAEEAKTLNIIDDIIS